ncbi:MAG: hypothetical protein GXY26_01900 [Clostridiales bacterium]|jgi:anti-sigma28 factor (negative regulator of flagellin synthesis)|nr:hypothetical protein [Clostridiales bacterium]
MEINHIQNFYRLQNTPDAARVKRTSEGPRSEAFETCGKDEVAISSDASFKAALSSYAKAYASNKNQEVSAERVEALKSAYSGDNCPVSGRDVAAAVIKYTFGTDTYGQKGR